MKRTPMHVLTVALALALVVVLAPVHVVYGAGTDNSPSPLEVRNEFIKIVVNPGPKEAGRFGIETTGGDPGTTADNNLPIIYGRPMPWTSYTTVRIDGVDWVYGGPTTRRAGRSGRYGEPIRPPEVAGDKIVSSYALGDIVVTQQLWIVKGPATGYPDTVRVHYMVENAGDATRSVGLRLLLDTQLGWNDGAPLRIGESSITTDTLVSGASIPDYWQAFDSIVEPSIVSQATLTGDERTRPSALAVSNWGNFADRLWDIQIVPGRPFTRELEQDLDSAAAMYWNPAPLAPGEVRHYVTYYGLGHISLAPGELALGVTSPASVNLGPDGRASFLVTAYLKNTGGGLAQNVAAQLVLPQWFELAPGQTSRRTVGDLLPNQEGQVTWQVVATRAAEGRGWNLTVDVSAKNAEPNKVSRSIDVIGPPRLVTNLMVSPRDVEVVDEQLKLPVRVILEIWNDGGSPAYWVQAGLESIGGFSLVPGDRGNLAIGHLEPRGKQTVTWRLSGRPGEGAHEITASASAQNAKSEAKSTSVRVPALKPKVTVVADKSQAKAGDIVYVDVMITNVQKFSAARFDLKYDPNLLDVAMVSRGTLFAVDDRLLPWESGDVWSTAGVVRGVSGRTEEPTYALGSAARFYFVAKASGTTAVYVDNLVLLDESGEDIGLAPIPCTIRIAAK